MYDNLLEPIEGYVFGVCLLVEIILMPLMVYLTAFRSRQMKRYRFYILNNVVWCFIFDIGPFLLRPTFTFPSGCMIMRPIISVSNTTARVWAFLLLVVCINMEMGVVWSLFYRYAQAFPGWFSDFFEHGYPIYILIVCFQITMYLSCLIPFMVFSIPGEMRQELLLQLPQLKAEEPNIAYVCVPNNTLSQYTALLGFVLMGVFFTVGTGLYINLFVRIQLEKRKDVVIENTQRLQLMLFKAVGVQLWVGYALLLFPTATIFLTFYCQWKNGTTIAMLSLTLMTTHGALDYATMLWFITPYRRIVQGWLGMGEAKKRSNPSMFGVTTITVVNSNYRASFASRSTFRAVTR